MRGEVATVARLPHALPLPAQALRPRLLRRPSARALALVAAALVVLGLGYLVARETPIFAVRTVEVTGAPPAVERDIRAAAAPFLGKSLVGLDRGELDDRLAALSSLRSFEVDRAFPNTLRIAVVAERPAAVLRRGPDAWLVSERGRVIARVEKDARKDLPRIRLQDQAPPVPGAALAGAETQDALAAVAAMPARFGERVRSVRTRAGSITLVLDDGPDVRLGGADELPLKIAVAAAVLRSLSPEEEQALAYLDVSAPERPVGGTNPQVSG